MPNPFAKIAFTDSVKKTQEQYGVRRANERLENIDRLDELTHNEAVFIGERDGFYMATVNEDGHPYVQFRGGPKGFLKVLDEKTLGYADFRGNLQYISVGNIAKNNKAAIFLMDYPNQSRLKIFAEIEVIDAANDPALIKSLTMPDYAAKIERVMVLHVTAYDWNCPQHITPRFTLEEIEAGTKPLHDRIAELEAELAALKIANRA
ncbi:MAG TPA: pyridoxamine 5'-phosphate oxidase family protein [Pyrinomonadaceae bacterium]|nr:pyridoxamine 5'-phosphate oxidase family protein [Pyrinomonadaceae bacterium]